MSRELATKGEAVWAPGGQHLHGFQGNKLGDRLRASRVPSVVLVGIGGPVALDDLSLMLYGIKLDPHPWMIQGINDSGLTLALGSFRASLGGSSDPGNGSKMAADGPLLLIQCD